MNLANLENAEVLNRAANILRENDKLNCADTCILIAEKLSKPPTPTVEVGQVWRSNEHGYILTVIAVHDDAAWCKYNESDCATYGTNTFAYLLANYTLQTPAPEAVEAKLSGVEAQFEKIAMKLYGIEPQPRTLTADDVSDVVLLEVLNTGSLFFGEKLNDLSSLLESDIHNQRMKIAAAITAYLAEVAK